MSIPTIRKYLQESISTISIPIDITWIAIDFDGVLAISAKTKSEIQTSMTDREKNLFKVHSQIVGISFKRKKTYMEAASILKLSNDVIEEILDLYSSKLELNHNLFNACIKSRKKLLVLSNNFGVPISGWLKRKSIDKYIHHVITPDSVRHSFRKPFPEMYKHALKIIGEPYPERLLFIDDRHDYIEGAKALNIQTIHYTHPTNKTGSGMI
mgnify:CR=1 FL=1